MRSVDFGMRNCCIASLFHLINTFIPNSALRIPHSIIHLNLVYWGFLAAKPRLIKFAQQILFQQCQQTVQIVITVKLDFDLSLATPPFYLNLGSVMTGKFMGDI